MKLPKGLGNMGAIMKQAQEAMKRAQELEQELAMEEIATEKNGVSVRYNGNGEILSLKVSPDLVDPEDVETLEDSLLLALREGYEKAGDLRKRKMAEITGGLPTPPGMPGF